MEEQFASWTELEDEVELALILERVFQTDYERMSHRFLGLVLRDLPGCASQRMYVELGSS